MNDVKQATGRTRINRRQQRSSPDAEAETRSRLIFERLLDISDKERRRVGRDLHDSVGSKLTGAALMGKALAQRLASKSKIEAALAEEVVKCINECIAQTRVIARGLCPIELKTSGLTTALQQLAADTQRRTGISCRFSAGKRVPLKVRFVMSHLFRIAQEAITNAVRHARPRRLEINLSRENQKVQLEIADDGRGLPKAAMRAPGLGLSTMQYRAELLGGQLAIERARGGGTRVCCTIPLAGKTREACP